MEDSPSAVAVTPLRRRLLVLTAAGILPLAVMAGVGLYALAAQQRAAARRVGVELARSVATAIDAQLDSSGSVLAALATTLTLDQRRPRRVSGARAAHPRAAARLGRPQARGRRGEAALRHARASRRSRCRR